jgi:signal transduction histidine kinase
LTEPPAPDWILSQVRRLEHQLQRVTEVFDRLPDLSRPSSGRIDLRLDDVGLNEVVRDVFGGFQTDSQCPNARCVSSNRTGFRGLWNYMRLEQVCRNLLSNAIGYGAHRPIDVRIEGMTRSSSWRPSPKSLSKRASQ